MWPTARHFSAGARARRLAQSPGGRSRGLAELLARRPPAAGRIPPAGHRHPSGLAANRLCGRHKCGGPRAPAPAHRILYQTRALGRAPSGWRGGAARPSLGPGRRPCRRRYRDAARPSWRAYRFGRARATNQPDWAGLDAGGARRATLLAHAGHHIRWLGTGAQGRRIGGLGGRAGHKSRKSSAPTAMAGRCWRARRASVSLALRAVSLVWWRLIF